MIGNILNEGATATRALAIAGGLWISYIVSRCLDRNHLVDAIANETSSTQDLVCVLVLPSTAHSRTMVGQNLEITTATGNIRAKA